MTDLRILCCLIATLLPLASLADEPAATPAAPIALVPITTAKPNLPDAACQQRLSGWVELEFAVMPDGKVADIRVTDAEPKGVFDAAAVESVSHWIYAPRELPAKAHQRLPMTFADCRAEQLRAAEPPTDTGAASQADCPALAAQGRQAGEQIDAADAGRAVLTGESAQTYSAPNARCAVANKKLKGGKLFAFVEYQGFSLVSGPKKGADSGVWVRSNALRDTGESLPATNAPATATAATPPAPGPAPAASPPAEPSAELRRAIVLADAFLPSLSLKPAEYALVEARYKGPASWRLTYKTCGGKRPGAEPVCKGGETFIGVDLNTGKASLLGAGE